MKMVAQCLAIVLLTTGCISQYPLGMNREQWEALPAEKQAEYQAKQYAINEERRQQREAQRMEQEKYEREQAMARAERLRLAYANAQYGDIVRVTIQGGFLQVYNKRYPYHPVSFELIKGEVKNIVITRMGQISQSVTFPAWLSDDGNMLFFDDSGSCQIVLANRDWERGETYPPCAGCANTSLAGAIFTIKYKDLPGGPQRIIIEGKRLNGSIGARH